MSRPRLSTLLDNQRWNDGIYKGRRGSPTPEIENCSESCFGPRLASKSCRDPSSGGDVHPGQVTM